MRYISLFSGIEAASVAWKDLDGWEPVAFSEIDKFPSAVLAYRFPDVPNLGDITKIDWSEVIAKHGAVDLIVGGSPCQSFSIAGGRESLDGESRLMFEYIRAVGDVRPKWFLWENVPGVLSTRDDAFEQLLSEMEKFGYGMAWHGERLTLNSSEWRKDADVSFLSDALETGEQLRRYCLSSTACQGILNRAAKNGKSLPEPLLSALQTVAAS